MSMLNLVRLFASYFLSRVLRKAVHSGAPFAITLEPTNRCNLHCPECPSGAQSMSRPRGFMELETYKKILASLDRGTLYLNLYFQGEPFLHPDFFEMVRLAKEKGLYVNTSTNGHFLDPENARKTIASHLDRIIISLDGADQPAYGSYRTGGSLKTVQDGIRNLAEARKRAGTRKPGIVAQFLVLKTNEHQLPEMKKLARELGADRLEIKSAQFYDFELGHPLMPEGKKYNRYRIRVNGSLRHHGATAPSYTIKNRLPDHCLRMWTSCAITWEGTVVPCCFDKDAAYPMGNIRDQDFKGIWRSGEYSQFRQRILSDRKSIDICRNCTSGMGLGRII